MAEVGMNVASADSAGIHFQQDPILFDFGDVEGLQLHLPRFQHYPTLYFSHLSPPFLFARRLAKYPDPPSQVITGTPLPNNSIE